MTARAIPLTGYMPDSIPTAALALEHTLIMLLLLAGLLSISRERRRFVPWVVLAGVALSVFTPVHSIDLAWPFISALVLPPLLWQIALRLATGSAVPNPREALAWVSSAALIGLALGIGLGISVASALLLGVLAASLMWQAREQATDRTDLSVYGQLALALLLAEVDVTSGAFRPILGRVFVGVGLGLILGWIGVRLALRLPPGKARNYFCLGLAYTAYLVGLLIEASGVITVTMSGLIVAVYGLHVRLWPDAETLPAPLNQPAVFALLATVFLVLGWQAHVPVTVNHALGISLGLIAAMVGIFVARLVAPLPAGTAQPLAQALLQKGRKVVLLLLGTFLLWPKEAILTAGPVAVALAGALLAVLLMRLLPPAVLSLADLGSDSPRPATEDQDTTVEDPRR